MADTIRKGAEADISVIGDRVLKQRKRKAYRITDLDARLRRQRTRREAKNLEKAEALGVRTPKLFKSDEKNFILEMEYLDGELVKGVFERGEKLEEISVKVGLALRLMHDGGLVHNDLTTSNIILHDGEVYLIDFGLGFHTERLEDQAMDLVVFKKSIQATHTVHSDKIWAGLLAGYRLGKEMLARIGTIERRGRYK